MAAWRVDGGGEGWLVGVVRQRLKAGEAREVGALVIDDEGDAVGRVEGVDDGNAVGG